jgi:hypothetical protein
MKHIICSGCSFTRQYRRLGLDGTDTDFLLDPLFMWRWPHHIQDMYSDVKVYNLGNPTNDNTIITHYAIKKLTELLNEGIPSNDIKVLIQWSDQDRDSYFFSKEVIDDYECEVLPPYDNGDSMLDDRWSHLSTFAEKNHFENKWGYYLLNGGFVWNHIKYPTDILETNAKYVSPEQSLIRFCSNYILFQNLCKVKNIDWFSFSLSYNFYDNKSFKSREWCNNGQTKNIFIDKVIDKFKMDFDTKNPYIKYLIDEVDFDKTYLYKDTNTNIGGITEWAISNFDLETDEEIFMEHSLVRDYKNFEEFYNKNPKCGMGHVSQQMNKKFVKTILKSFLEKNLE